MSRAATHRLLWPSYIAFLLFVLILTSMTLQRVDASPLSDLTQKYGSSTIENSTENLMGSSMENSMDSSTDNSTEIASNTDVYVIKAVVYEIGILTDTDNTTSSESTSSERQEKIDISLYGTPQEDEFS